jgi:gas vesicle protein
MYLADELVAPGGPSAPVWAFFTALIGGVIALLSAQIKAKNDASQLREEIRKTRESTEKAEKNTRNVSNGFAGRVDSNFETLISAQEKTTDNLGKLQAAFQKHLEWHLEKEGK